MTLTKVRPSGRESHFDENEIIVSKTDLKGRITYANQVFLRVAHLSLQEAMGEPHSLIRHPDMPRCVFKLLWDTIQDKREIFAYVLNMAANGDHYWVRAQVTPIMEGGKPVAYMSVRQRATREEIAEWYLKNHQSHIS